MISRAVIGLALSLASVVLAGCPSPYQRVGSRAVDVGAIDATFEARSDGTTLRVVASLTRDGYDQITLEPGDTLTTIVGSDSEEMVEEDDPDGRPHYVAKLPAPSAEAKVTVTFARQVGRPGAPSSTTSLPAPFAIASTAIASVRRTDPIELTLDTPPVSAVYVAAEGSCVAGGFDAPGALAHVDGKRVTVDAAALHLRSEPADCTITLHVRAIASGHVDPALREGSTRAFDGIQERTTSLHVVP